jgi:hypothetical protein
MKWPARRKHSMSDPFLTAPWLNELNRDLAAVIEMSLSAVPSVSPKSHVEAAVERERLSSRE